MSEIRNIELQGCASPIRGLTRVAVMCWAPDGWRVYEAMHVLPVGRSQEAVDKAVVWTHQHGNKLSKEQARRYFHIPDDMEFAR